jgi:hypothetical protein
MANTSINCNELGQTALELQMKFKNCSVLNATDLDAMIDLIMSVKECNNDTAANTTWVSADINIDTLDVGIYQFDATLLPGGTSPTYDNDNKLIKGTTLSPFLYNNTIQLTVTKIVDKLNQSFYIQKIVNYYNGEIFQRRRVNGRPWLKLTI